MKIHGWLGLIWLLGCEALLVAGVDFVATWFTPLMWTGYILLVDALVARRAGSSWITRRPREFGFLVVLSVLSWLLFEAYNLKLKNWAYIGVPEAPWARNLGYLWSFATITPALFQTAGFLEAYFPPGPAAPINARWQAGRGGLMALAGLALVVVPPLLPDSVAPYTFGFVWLGFIFLLEPINRSAGQPSLLQDWLDGRRGRVWRWLAAGLACGLIWEAWNVQALSQDGAGWLYTMPALIHDLVFGLHYGQMPVAGLLGFPPFALESFAIYYFLRWALRLETWVEA